MIAAMKYVVCVPDGCADEPVAELGGRTPLEVGAPARRSTALAARGEVGRAAVIPAGMPPGSDVGNMSIFGYDPATFHTGRAPIEAAALGPALRPDQVAYRCNLVTVGATARWSTSPAGTPPPRTRPRSSRPCRTSSAATGSSSTPASSTATSWWRRPTGPTPTASRPTTSPTSRWCCPTGPAGPELRRLMEASAARSWAGFGLAANQIWLWGQGFQPADAELQRRSTASTPPSAPRSTWCGASACSPTSRSSTSRA